MASLPSSFEQAVSLPGSDRLFRSGRGTKNLVDILRLWQRTLDPNCPIDDRFWDTSNCIASNEIWKFGSFHHIGRNEIGFEMAPKNSPVRCAAPVMNEVQVVENRRQT